MFKYEIQHQESYSRGELILRALFGWLYIGIPHIFCLYFILIALSLLNFVAFWIILFTGKLPKFYFNFFVGTYRWSARFNASYSNLVDGYPAFGFEAKQDDKIIYELEYVEKYSRGQLLLVALFGWLYVGIPHLFILIFRYIWISILSFLAFWAVLFTGKYPKGWHEFIVNTNRWMERVGQYLLLVRTEYPPFNGLPDDKQPSE